MKSSADENWAFRSWLKQYAPHDIDGLVKTLSQKYFALIDCAQCANCCRSLHIELKENAFEELKAKLAWPRPWRGVMYDAVRNKYDLVMCSPEGGGPYQNPLFRLPDHEEQVSENGESHLPHAPLLGADLELRTRDGQR
jgi:hypothetical protein